MWYENVLLWTTPGAGTRSSCSTSKQWRECWASSKLCGPNKKKGNVENFVHGTGDYSTLDIVSWFQAHSHYIGLLKDNAHAVDCPWIAEHTSAGPPTGSDTVIFENGDGWPGFYCHHSHCAGRNITDVLSAWGDADVFCTQQWRARR